MPVTPTSTLARSLINAPVGGLRGIVRMVLAAVFALLTVQGTMAGPADAILSQVEARYQDLREQSATWVGPDRPDAGFALGASAASAGAAAFGRVDLRLALLKLAREEEAEARDIILSAQGARGMEALSLEKGRVDLPRLLKAAARLFPGSVGPDGIGVPVIVEQGATLMLRRREVLTLNRAAGAFLVNFGRLDIRGGGIVAAGPVNAGSDAFAPFVATAGQGVMSAQDGYFAGLGFGAGPVFAGVSVVVSGFYQADTPSALTGSTLRGVGSTVFVGSAGVEIADNRFVDPPRTALILRATSDARIHRNVFLDGAAGDAIRLAARATGTDIRGNEIFNPLESGIAVLRESHGTIIEDVTIWRPRHFGVHADLSNCVAMRGLRILGARQDGVALDSARGVVLADSAVIGSDRAGLLVRDLPDDALTILSGNLFAVNRTGIETAAPGRLDLRGNDFQDQFPRFLAGDVQFMTPSLLRDLTGEARIVLTGGAAPVPDSSSIPPTCPTFPEQ